MLKRTRSKTKLFASEKENCSHQDIENEPPQKKFPSPPHTPSKRQGTKAPMTPTAVRHIAKELEQFHVKSPSRNSATSVYLTASQNDGENLFQEAKAVFRRTAVPSRLVGRSEERERMMTFWKEHVLGNRPGCLYISGSPGTGKTAMLTEVIRRTDNDVMNLKTHYVRTVMVNCMSINEPKGIYTKLVQELKAPRAAVQSDVVQQAKQLLNGKKDTLNVVVLDEIDHLVTKDQDVLYRIFEWASTPSSRLVLIGIANALDLTDRLLPRLRAKNCEPQLLNFNPYQVSEITAIIKDRLYSLEKDPENPFAPAPTPKEGAPLPLMQPAAVELCARKVAASMGDLRTALDVCRQAIEIAQVEQKQKAQKSQVLGEHNGNATANTPRVTIAHVMKVIQGVFGSPTVQKLKQLNLQQKVVLGVLMIMSKSAKGSRDHVTLGKFRERYNTLCSSSDNLVTPVSNTELTDVLAMVETLGIITIGKSKEDRARRIALNVQESEIMQMIEAVPLLDSWIRTIT